MLATQCTATTQLVVIRIVFARQANILWIDIWSTLLACNKNRNLNTLAGIPCTRRLRQLYYWYIFCFIQRLEKASKLLRRVAILDEGISDVALFSEIAGPLHYIQLNRRTAQILYHVLSGSLTCIIIVIADKHSFLLLKEPEPLSLKISCARSSCTRRKARLFSNNAIPLTFAPDQLRAVLIEQMLNTKDSIFALSIADRVLIVNHLSAIFIRVPLIPTDVHKLAELVVDGYCDAFTVPTNEKAL